MPVVNPGIRRYIGSAIQRLFNSASFSAPLTHSLTLERGTGTPTFTRATTATFQDHEGVLRTAIAGEARFTGARRVRNLLTFTEDFSNAAWLKSSGGAGSSPVVTSDQDPNPISGVAYADKVVFTAPGAGDLSILQQSFTGTTGSQYIGSFYVKAFAAGDVGKVILFRHAAGGSYTQITLTSSYQRVALKETGIGAAAFDIGLRPTFSSSAGTVSIYLTASQLEDITGRTDQTTPSEYVSVGQLSAPYHGAGVDGVKYFDTDLSRNPIAASTLKGYLSEPAATNLCLQSNSFGTAPWVNSGGVGLAQNAVGPDGAVSAWTVTDSDPGAADLPYQQFSLTAATHTFSIFVGKTVGAQDHYPVLWVNSVSNKTALMTIDTSNGVATVWTAATGYTVVTSSARCASHNADLWRVELTFLATAETWYIYLSPATTSNPAQSTGAVDTTETGPAVYYGAQVELGSAATSYIPTTTVAVARNADVLTYTGGDIASLKTLAATFQRAVGVSALGAVVGVNDNTFNNYNYCYLNSATQFKFEGYAGGVEQWKTTASNAYTPGTQFKAASSAAANSILMDLNGTAQTADMVATIPVVTRLDVGHIEGGSQLNGNVGGIYGWTRNLSQSELGAVDR